MSISHSIANLFPFREQLSGVCGGRRVPTPPETLLPFSQTEPATSRHWPDFPAEFASISSGSPAAMRVKSRQPPAVSGKSACAVARATAEATRCGKWLVVANALSCAAGDMTSTDAPRPDQKSATACDDLRAWCSASRSDDHHAAFEQIGPRIFDTAFFRCQPADDCRQSDCLCASFASTLATIDSFVLPASVRIACSAPPPRLAAHDRQSPPPACKRRPHRRRRHHLAIFNDASE